MENNKTKALKDEQEIPELTTVHKILLNKELIKPDMDQSAKNQIITTIKDYLQQPQQNDSKLLKLRRILKKSGIVMPELNNHKPKKPTDTSNLAVIKSSIKYPFAYMQRIAHNIFASVDMQAMYLPVKETSSFIFIKIRDGLKSSDYIRKNDKSKDDSGH